MSSAQADEALEDFRAAAKARNEVGARAQFMVGELEFERKNYEVAYKEFQRAGYRTKDAIKYMDRAAGTLDLSKVPKTMRDDVGFESTLRLKEIFGHLKHTYFLVNMEFIYTIVISAVLGFGFTMMVPITIWFRCRRW